jgi:hypothetical protein
MVRRFSSLAVLLIVFGCVGALAARQAHAEESWRAEFDDLCSKTTGADSLSAEQLRELIARCDRLSVKLEALDEAPRKVYTKRLRTCRDFFGFMLEAKEKGATP